MQSTSLSTKTEKANPWNNLQPSQRTKGKRTGKENAEDDGYELEEGKTYRVTHQMDVWCKKKNEE